MDGYMSCEFKAKESCGVALFSGQGGMLIWGLREVWRR